MKHSHHRKIATAAVNRALAFAAFLFLGLHSAQAFDSFTPVYRFWNDFSGSHFFTISTVERDFVNSNYPEWDFEGSSWNALTAAESGATPIYRFYSDLYMSHFFTISLPERNYVIGNYPEWEYEGIAFYAFPAPASHTQPVYRFYSREYDSHFFTASQQERDYVAALYDDDEWSYEGKAWYSPPSAEEPGDWLTSALAVSPLSTFYESIDTTGDQDWYRVAFSDGDFEIFTEGSTDTLAFLFDADGVLIDSDDDSGANLNFYMGGVISAGTYYLMVRHYDETSGTGAYTLKFVQPQPLPTRESSSAGVTSCGGAYTACRNACFFDSSASIFCQADCYGLFHQCLDGVLTPEQASIARSSAR
jgi:hypothetical protein